MDIDFLQWKLKKKSYITKKTLLTIKQVKIVWKIEFEVIAFNLK